MLLLNIGTNDFALAAVLRISFRTASMSNVLLVALKPPIFRKIHSSTHWNKEWLIYNTVTYYKTLLTDPSVWRTPGGSLELRFLNSWLHLSVIVLFNNRGNGQQTAALLMFPWEHVLFSAGGWAKTWQYTILINRIFKVINWLQTVVASINPTSKTSIVVIVGVVHLARAFIQTIFAQSLVFSIIIKMLVSSLSISIQFKFS